MSSYLVDTHPLIWLKSANKKKLSGKVKKIFDRVDDGKDFVYIPAPVIWELGAYYRSRKFKLKNYVLFRHWVNKEILFHPNILFLETILEDVLLAGDFKVNQDPFDNLIVATAVRMQLPLITKDENIKSCGACEVLWD